MISTHNIRHIIFDLGRVLVDIEPDRTEKELTALLPLRYDAFHEEVDPVFPQFEKGLISEFEFFESLQKLAKTGTRISDIRDAWNAMLIGIPEPRLQMLSQLKEKYSLFVLSNTNSSHIACVDEHMRKEHGIEDFEKEFFVKSYYSHKIHQRKPDLACYQYVLSDSGIDPRESIFIDDHLNNVQGALQAGIPSIHKKAEEEITELCGRLFG